MIKEIKDKNIPNYQETLQKNANTLFTIFRNNRKLLAKSVPLENIHLTDNTYTQDTIHFDLKRTNYYPLIVTRDFTNPNKYHLIGGINRYFVSKVNNVEYIDVIIADVDSTDGHETDRIKLLDNIMYCTESTRIIRTIDIEKVKLSKRFLERNPSYRKLQKASQEIFLNNNKQTHPIVLDENDILIDGYMQYLILRRNSNKKIKYIVGGM